MANIVITSDANRIYIVFNDYSDEAGIVSGNWDKSAVSTEMNDGNIDVFFIITGSHQYRLSYNLSAGSMIVDSIDGAAPSSNSDLQTKLNAALEIPTGGGAWGSITGTLSDQTDLQTALDAKHNNPTGTPDGTKYLRDDNTWQAVTGGSGLAQYQVRRLIRR